MNLFKSDDDRALYIKLCAEMQIVWEKSLTYFDKESQTNKPTLQALNPRDMKTALEIAERQLVHDEKEGKLRYTLEALLNNVTDKEILDYHDGKHKEYHQAWIKQFESLK